MLITKPKILLNQEDETAQQYYNRHDKNANILTLVEIQCQWLREIGFTDVDCFFKTA